MADDIFGHPSLGAGISTGAGKDIYLGFLSEVEAAWLTSKALAEMTPNIDPDAPAEIDTPPTYEYSETAYSTQDTIFGYPPHPWAPAESVASIRESARDIYPAERTGAPSLGDWRSWKPSWADSFMSIRQGKGRDIDGTVLESTITTVTQLTQYIVDLMAKWYNASRTGGGRDLLQQLFYLANTFPVDYINAGQTLLSQYGGQVGTVAEVPFITSHRYLAQIFSWQELLTLAIDIHNKAKAADGGGTFIKTILLPPDSYEDPLQIEEEISGELIEKIDAWINDWPAAEGTPGVSTETIADVGRLQREIYYKYRVNYDDGLAGDPYPTWADFTDEWSSVLGSRIELWDSQPPPPEPEDHEMRIGLCKFKIPPTSVTVEERFTQLLSPTQGIRTSSNPKFSSGHSNTMISLKLLFADFEDMWGIPYDKASSREYISGTGGINKTDVPDDPALDKMASSLRGLIAQFKASPFLPLRNKYLNETHNIDAVTLAGLTLSVVEGFPYQIEVDLQLMKFNYKAYLPHAYDFNDCIFWGRYRHYLSGMMQRIDNYVSFQWLAIQHSDAVPIVDEKTGETTGYRTPKWAETDEDGKVLWISEDANRLKDLELFYVSEAVRPAEYPKVPFYDDLYYERAEAYLDEETRDQRKAWWASRVSFFTGEDVQDYDGLSLESLLGNPEKKDPAMWTLLSSLIDVEGSHHQIKPYMVKKLEDMYLNSVNPPTEDSSDEDDAARRAIAHYNALATILLFVVEGWMRSDEYKTQLENALKERGYSSIYEWEVPMVPLYLDKEKVKVDSIAVSLSNRIANLQLQLADEPTHQHIGAGDTSCQISLTISGESEIKKLVELVDRVQALSRHERANACLGFWGVKNFVTAMAGMKYCLPVSMNYNTIPGYPHLYKVFLELIDFDVFQQKRESLSSDEREALIKEVGKMNPFLRLKQNAKYFNCYPDLPLELKGDNNEHLGYLEPDFYYVASQMETQRWISEQGGLVSADAVGDKSYPWPHVNVYMNSVPDTSYVSSLALTRYGGDNELKLGVPDNVLQQATDKYREQLIQEGLTDDEVQTKLDEAIRTKLEEEGYPEDMIEEHLSSDSSIKKMLFLDFLGARHQSINPEILGVNQFFKDNISNNFDAMLEHTANSDLRGRMIRAFPTYHLLVIDEGGYIFGYKLFDDFYGLSSVIDFSLHRSEDVVGDTLQLRLSNFYGKLSTPIITGFQTIYGQGGQINKALQERLNMSINLATGLTDKIGVPTLDDENNVVWSPLDHIELQPGVRVQLRLGYSSDINNLPVVFNGTVTEVSAGDIMNVTCQGDGIELLSLVNAGEKDGHSGCVDGAWFSGWDMSEPRDLIIELMTFGGSVMRQAAAAATRGAIMGDSRFGIRHFGHILWEPNPKEKERQGSLVDTATEMSKEYEGHLKMKDKMNPTEGEEGYWTMPGAVTTALLNEEKITDALKLAFANLCLSRDLEIYKRNVYPGNGTGILEMIGVDSNNTVGGMLNSLQSGFAWSGIAVSGVTMLASIPAILLGHPLLAGLLVTAGSAGFALTGLGTYLIGEVKENAEKAWGPDAPTGKGSSLLDIIGAKDEDKSGPEDPFCEISMQLYTYQRTVWDLMQDCAALLPNYIVAVRPWEHRSTLFYGKAHWLYTSGIWPITNGIKVGLPIDSSLMEYLEELIKDDEKRGRWAQESAKAAAGAGAGSAPPSDDAGGTYKVYPDEIVTNYLDVTDAEKLAECLRANGWVGHDTLYPDNTRALLDAAQAYAISPALIVAMSVKETTAGTNLNACTGNGSDWNLWGIKWSSKFSAWGSIGPVSPEGDNYTKFNDYSGAFKACAFLLREYVDCFKEGDGWGFPDDWDLLTKIGTRWVRGKHTLGPHTEYANFVAGVMETVWNAAGSGTAAVDSQQADVDAGTHLVLFSVNESILNDIADYLFFRSGDDDDSVAMGDILEDDLPYDNIHDQIEGAKNRWLHHIWGNQANLAWWTSFCPYEGAIFTLLWTLKYNKLAYQRGETELAQLGWRDQAQNIHKIFTGEASSRLTDREELFPAWVRNILNAKAATPWPEDLYSVESLSDSYRLWEFLDVPVTLDYVTGDTIPSQKGARSKWIPRETELDTIDEGVYKNMDAVMASVWGLRSQYHRQTSFEYYDSENPIIDAVPGSEIMSAENERCSDHTAVQLFADFFLRGEQAGDDHVAGEFFTLWQNSNRYHPKDMPAYGWPRLLIDTWASDSTRPAIFDSLWALVKDEMSEAFMGDPSYSNREVNGKDWSFSGESTIHKSEHNYEGEFGYKHDKEPDYNYLKECHEWAQLACQAIGAGEKIYELLALVAIYSQRIYWDNHGILDKHYNILAQCVMHTINLYRYVELKLKPAAFSAGDVEAETADGIYVSNANLVEWIRSGLQGRLDPENVNKIVSYAEQVLELNKSETEIGSTTTHGIMNEFGKKLFGFIQTAMLVSFPAAFVPTHSYTEGVDDTQSTGTTGMYLPAYVFPIITTGSDYSYSISDHSQNDFSDYPAIPDFWGQVATFIDEKHRITSAKPVSMAGTITPIAQEASMSMAREQLVFKTYGPRPLFRKFLGEVINPNDWAIAWCAVVSSYGKSALSWMFGLGSGVIPLAIEMTGVLADADEGNKFFGPICEAFAAWLRSNQSREDTYQWMLDHQTPGNHDTSAIIHGLKSAGRTVFGFVDEIFKNLWGLALMGSAGFASGLSVARFMSNFSNILNRAFNDSIYYVEGPADNPFTREFGEPVIEIREPFQKFWIIDSYSDIIDNQIICSSENVYPVVTATSGGGNPQTVFADRSIYPENQKEKVVETYLKWEEPKWYEMIDQVISGLQEKYLLEKGCPYNVQAKRVACHHLKESLKDMYGGDVFTLGRPEIQPHDIVYICDLYENICGLVEVEAVTHHFSAETGFVTAITPNALVSVNDPGKWNLACQIKAAGDALQAHKCLKQMSTQALQTLANETPGPGGYLDDNQQMVEEAINAFRGGYADWLYNMSKGVDPSYSDILNSALENVGGGVTYATDGHGVAQTELQAVTDWFLNHNLIKLQKWSVSKEVSMKIYVPLIGKWVGNFLGLADDVITWFQENFIDYPPVSMFLLLKKGEPWAAGIGGHAGLVVGEPDSRSLLPTVLDGLIDVKTGEFIKPYDVLGRLGYTKADSVRMVRYINMFHTNAIGKARVERGEMEMGALPVGTQAQILTGTIGNVLDYPKGCIDGDTFWCLSGGYPLKIRLRAFDAPKYYPIKDEDGNYIDNTEIGTFTDEQGHEHECEEGGYDYWNLLRDLLPTVGKNVWLVVNPFDETSYDRTLALVYPADEYADEEAVRNAPVDLSINFRLFRAGIEAGYPHGEWVGPIEDYGSDVVGGKTH